MSFNENPFFSCLTIIFIPDAIGNSLFIGYMEFLIGISKIFLRKFINLFAIDFCQV